MEEDRSAFKILTNKHTGKRPIGRSIIISIIYKLLATKRTIIGKYYARLLENLD